MEKGKIAGDFTDCPDAPKLARAPRKLVTPSSLVKAAAKKGGISENQRERGRTVTVKSTKED